MSSLIHRSALLKELADHDFLHLTLKQIAKDFGKVNSIFLNIFPAQINSFDALLDEVKIHLSKQLEIGERETLQLCYTIDVPEKTFLEHTQHPDFIDKLSQEIIYREAYKVWLRRKYS